MQLRTFQRAKVEAARPSQASVLDLFPSRSVGGSEPWGQLRFGRKYTGHEAQKVWLVGAMSEDHLLQGLCFLFSPLRPQLFSPLAVPCVSGGLPKPTNITFFSINMRNILQWSPPEGLQEAELTYTVQYFM